MAPTVPPNSTTSSPPPKTFDQKVEEVFHLKASFVYFLFALGIFVIILISCSCIRCRSKQRKKRPQYSGKMGAVGPDVDDELDTVPRLVCAIHYYTGSQYLSIGIINACNLPGKEKNINSYVRLKTSPQSHGSDLYPQKETKVNKRNLNPSWREFFMFGMQPKALTERELSFELWNFVENGVDLLIGTAYLNLRDIKGTEYFDRRCVQSLSIEINDNPTPLHGEMCLALRYERKTTAYEIAVTIIEARNIPVHPDRTKEIYICLTFAINGKKIAHKRTKKKTLAQNPYFNETFRFWTDLATEILSSTITIKIDVKSGMFGKRCVGEVHIGREVGDIEQRKFWTEVVGNPRRQYARWYPVMPIR